MCAHICTLTHMCMHKCTSKFASTQVHMLSNTCFVLIANNGCQLGSRCSRQHNWAPLDLFFQLSWRRETERNWKASDLGRERRKRLEGQRWGSPQREGRGIQWGSGKPPLRPWQPVIQTIRELMVLPTTSQSQENDKNQHWMCLCWGNVRGTPLAFLISSFSLFLPFTFPIFPFFLPPSHHPSCLYFLTVHAVLYMPSTRVRGQLS